MNIITLSHTTRIVHAVALAAAVLVSLRPVYATDGTWTGGGADGAWQNDANWSASPFPGTAANVYTSTEGATFGPAGGGAVDLGGTINIRDLFLGSSEGGAAAFVIGDADDILNLSSSGSAFVNGFVTANQAVGVGGTVVNLSSANNSSYSFLNFGSGTLEIAGTVTANQTTGNTSILTLGGSGPGIVSGAMANAGLAGDAGLAVLKNGSGTWTLSGANTYAGNTTVNGGRLVFDYSANTPLSASSPLTISGGEAVFKGAGAGSTAAAVSNLTLGALHAVNTLTLDAAGGDGVALTIGTLTAGSSSTLMSSLIDLSSSAGNSITVDALSTNIGVGVVGTGNVLMVGSVGNRRASIIVRDTNGYGFATLSSATGGTVGRLTAGTTLTAASSSSGVNYRLATAGTLTRTASLNFQTLTFDTAAGDITLDMDSYNVSATANGRGILYTGDNDLSIVGTGNLGSSTVFQNYGTGVMTISLAGSSFSMMFGGPGFTDFAGTVTSTGPTAGSGVAIGGGIVRFSKDQVIPNNYYIVSGGGVLEIGADLNGGTGGDFTVAVGTSSNNIRFVGDSGVSAAGTDRVANFGGAGAALTWGASGFLTNADGTTDGGYAFKLSSARSDANLKVENGIDLGGNTTRVIDVANGSAAIDATLSGTLTGDGAILVKTGTGTLELTAANTYSGGTVVSAGTLLLNNGADSGAGDGRVVVDGGGILGGTGGFTGALIVNSGGSLRPGASIETLASGGVTMNGGSAFGYEMDSSVAASVGADLLKVTGDLSFTDTVTLTLDNIAAVPAAFTEGTTFTLINYTGVWNGGLLTFDGNAIANGGIFTAGLNTWRMDYDALLGGSNFSSEYLGGSYVNITAVPEPSVLTAVLGGLGVLTCLRRRRA